MAEVALKANVAYVHNMPIEIRTGLVEIVGGHDDASTSAYDFVEDDTNAVGYTLMRYLAKNYSDGKPSDTIYIHNNDTETGNTGADTFIVTANTKAATINTSGKDTITDYDTGDKITLSSEISRFKVSGSNVVFTIGGGTTLNITNDINFPVTAGDKIKIIKGTVRGYKAQIAFQILVR